jgi:hypothetical protein
MAKKSNDTVIEKARERGEPLFTFRAQDIHSVAVLEFYSQLCQDDDHVEGIMEAIVEFKTWQDANVAEVREPD